MEQLQFIHYAEEARKAHSNDLSELSRVLNKKLYKEMGLKHCFCFAQTQPINGHFWHKEKYIHVKSDTNDNMQILCARIHKVGCNEWW